MKQCSNKNCKAINPQPLENFYKDSGNIDGRKHHCRTCLKIKNKKNYSDNKEVLKARTATWKKKNPDKNRNSILKSKYGISLPDYQKLLNSQGGCCAICNATKQDIKKSKHFYVDHNHTTGKVRGLLCYHCNIALGMLRDNITTALNLVEYLKKYEES